MHTNKATNGDLVPVTPMTVPLPGRAVEPTTDEKVVNLPAPVGAIDMNAIIQASAVSLKDVLGELKDIVRGKDCAAEISVTERIVYTEET